jgi:branched-chain amino acid transport system substrate-binding protein
MKKLLISALVVGIIGSFGAFANGQAEGNAASTIKIAVSAPMTGNYGEYGESFKNTIELAKDNWNAKGCVLGKQVEVVYGDSKASPQEAATLAQKFTSDGSIFAEIGDFTSACCMSAQPIYDSASMIQLSPTASHIGFAPGSKWSFEVLGTQKEMGKFMADWAYDEGMRKVAIIYLNSDWGVSVRDGFSKAFEKLGGNIIANEYYFDGETDFTAILTKLRDLKPDMLYVACYYNDGAAICLQKQRLDWNVPFYCAGTVYSPKFIELDGSAVNGIRTNVGFFPNDPSPVAAKLIDSYKKRYGTTPDYYGACAYDAFNILMEAIQKAGVLDTNKVRDELAKTTGFDGVTGTISFTPDGDATKSYVKLTIKDGKFTVIK